MSFLLDTNAVSEWVKPNPNAGFVRWLHEVDEDRTFLSVVTLTELRYGIEWLPASRRRQRLEDWLENDLPLRFEARILGIDSAIAHACGKLMARREALGRPMEGRDPYLAATAQVHTFTLVTRNASHFEGAVPSILNPWN